MFELCVVHAWTRMTGWQPAWKVWETHEVCQILSTKDRPQNYLLWWRIPTSFPESDSFLDYLCTHEFFAWPQQTRPFDCMVHGFDMLEQRETCLFQWFSNNGKLLWRGVLVALNTGRRITTVKIKARGVNPCANAFFREQTDTHYEKHYLPLWWMIWGNLNHIGVAWCELYVNEKVENHSMINNQSGCVKTFNCANSTTGLHNYSGTSCL